jgi:hypothetical protein
LKQSKWRKKDKLNNSSKNSTPVLSNKVNNDNNKSIKNIYYNIEDDGKESSLQSQVVFSSNLNVQNNKSLKTQSPPLTQTTQTQISTKTKSTVILPHLICTSPTSQTVNIKKTIIIRERLESNSSLVNANININEKIHVNNSHQNSPMINNITAELNELSNPVFNKQ